MLNKHISSIINISIIAIVLFIMTNYVVIGGHGKNHISYITLIMNKKMPRKDLKEKILEISHNYASTKFKTILIRAMAFGALLFLILNYLNKFVIKNTQSITLYEEIPF